MAKEKWSFEDLPLRKKVLVVSVAIIVIALIMVAVTVLANYFYSPLCPV